MKMAFLVGLAVCLVSITASLATGDLMLVFRISGTAWPWRRASFCFIFGCVYQRRPFEGKPSFGNAGAQKGESQDIECPRFFRNPQSAGGGNLILFCLLMGHYRIAPL